jgi:acetyltransferase-like isoleucine patch superfamily enzyme
VIFDLCWWLGATWFTAWAILPFALVTVLGTVPGMIAGTLLAPWSALIGMSALHRALPASRPGTYRFPDDAGALRWAFKQWAPSLYLTVFQPVCGQSERFLRLALRAFGATLGRDALLTSRTIVREPHHVRVGARSLVGEYAHLICSYQPRRGVFVVGRIEIEDDVLIGGYCHLAPGVRIGSGSRLEHAVSVGAHTIVGSNTSIGAGTAVYNNVRIGADVTIGKNCLIPSGARVADGTRIPDGTVLTGRSGPALVTSDA